MRGIILFKDVDDAHLAALWPRFRERRLRPREVLFRAGDRGEELFLIRKGTIVVSTPVKGRVEQVLARLGPGDFFGEMSLFDEEPRSATVQAEADAALLGLDRANLLQFIEANPRAAAAFFYQLVYVFSRRLRVSTSLVAEVTRWGLEATGLDADSPLPD